MSRTAEARDEQAARWLAGAAAVGRSPWLKGRPSISAQGGELRIGDRFRLASFPVPSHLVAGEGAALEIGHDVSIGHGAAISAFEHVSIGSGTQIGPFVIIMDTNFHGTDGDQSLQHDCRPVTIGANCRIGSRVTITRGATIGDGAEVLAGSVVSSSVPAGACVAGARARIIGRAGDPGARWDSPAAQLPEFLVSLLSLDAPPNLDATLLPKASWEGGGGEVVLASIARQLGIPLDPGRAGRIGTYAELAAEVCEAARRTPKWR